MDRQAPIDMNAEDRRNLLRQRIIELVLHEVEESRRERLAQLMYQRGVPREGFGRYANPGLRRRTVATRPATQNVHMRQTRGIFAIASMGAMLLYNSNILGLCGSCISQLGDDLLNFVCNDVVDGFNVTKNLFNTVIQSLFSRIF
ncbi:uncharacterized protein LOC119682500 [Teleopsis dalmanni]|uniref:uncharacterized protein LOC119682500 n=1 Tax=Teleopsis dalmanni TaxID=139649 RepID=UPI000D32B12F|nr:uncharacterized protein LOC119682500 [Teleopsis dalmanni]XP_037951884.1 uncharacterized protein LOC119682500 [Teleopsis dalmanni]XP_037951885.1 uncharacterized protein LOC119682500 [Teleopsis dalmanni]